MKRALICLGSLGALPVALAGVKQAAATGQPDLALACAVLAATATAAAAWIASQIEMAIRAAMPSRSYRGSRWTDRDGGAWR